MKTTREIFNKGLSPEECSRISHMVCLADFNTNYPNPSRIERVAREIDEYMNYKRKHMEAQGVN